MKGPWVKLWRSFLVDTTIQLLLKRYGNGVVTLLVTLMCYSDNGVVETPEEELALLAQMDDSEWTNLVDKVIEKGIISRDGDGKIVFINWSRYQQNDSAERVRKHREKVKSEVLHDRYSSVTDPLHQPLQCNNVTSRYKKIDIREERESTPPKKAKKTGPKSPYGSNANVMLTDDEAEKLKEQFGDDLFASRVEDLSCYLLSKGDKYKSHYGTILNWARKDGITKPAPEVSEYPVDRVCDKCGRTIKSWESYCRNLECPTYQ